MLAALGLRGPLRQLQADVPGHLNAPSTKGLVFAQSDDVHALGDPTQVHAGLERFSATVLHDLGVSSNPTKQEVYSHSGDISCFVGYARPHVPLADPNDRDCFGITVNGCPLGGPEYIKYQMEEKLTQTFSDIEKIISPLRFESPQPLLALLQFCIRPRLDHWARLMLPTVVGPFLRQFDVNFIRIAGEILHKDLPTNQLALRRAALPARLFGLGLRKTEDVCPAAFIAQMNSSARLLLDKPMASGCSIPGLAHDQFVSIFGTTDRDVFWDVFLASGCASAVAFADAHAQLVAELPPDEFNQDPIPDSKPLSVPIFEFGGNPEKLQNRITKQREQCRYDALHAEVQGMDKHNHARICLNNLSKMSTVITTPVISAECSLDPDTFYEVVALYLALPSPALSHFVGVELKQPGGRKVIIDEYGYTLLGAVLKGDGWRARHDTVKLCIDHILSANDMDVTTEVRDLFSSALSTAQQQAFNTATSGRRRQGIIPDFFIGAPGGVRHLYELKTINLCRSHYSDATRSPTSIRADKIPSEYVKHAQTLDQKILGTAVGVVGPVEAKLRSYGAVRPLVVGPFNDTSPGVEALLSSAAEYGSIKFWRLMGASDPASARGYLAWKNRRHLGFASWRAQARLILDRVPQLSSGYSAAAGRRTAQRNIFFRRDPASARFDFEQSRARHGGSTFTSAG